MSGGRLVVLDRNGREGKKYQLLSGLATLGSDPRCDIRVMLASVSGHHATVVVHTHQTVVRNVGDGETLVNGAPVSVAALRHGDVITVGERALRWEYADPAARRAHNDDLPALPRSARPGRGRRGRASEAAPPPLRSPALQLAIEMHHRASMPGNAGGKQVAIVQPQRRDTTEQNVSEGGRPSSASKRRYEESHTTKAEQWIQWRKSSPRRNNTTTSTTSTTTSSSAKAGCSSKPAALRVQILRQQQSRRAPYKLPPDTMDHTKQAAIMLMTGHTPKSRLPSPKAAKNTPTYVIKKHSPVRKTPRKRGSKSPRTSASKTSVSPRNSATPKTSVSTKTSLVNDDTVNGSFSPKTPSGTPPGGASSRRGSKRGSSSFVVVSSCSGVPRKSALRDPRSERSRKHDSIKFDLSNLDNYQPEHDTLASETSATEDELTLHYDTSGDQSPSPRHIHYDTSGDQSPSPRHIHSRSGRILQTLATPVSPRTNRTVNVTHEISPRSNRSVNITHEISPRSNRSVNITHEISPRSNRSVNITHEVSNRSNRTVNTTQEISPRSNHSVNTTHDLSPRRTSRGSIIIQKALESSGRSTKTLTDQTLETSRRSKTLDTFNHSDSTITSAFKTRTLSPRSPNQNLETYSIVDLVSVDSDSIYDSASSAYGTPRERKTRSTIDPKLIGSSTPYVSKNTKNSTINASITSKGSRRSKSLSTPETQKHISVNSTKVSRASRSRSRLNDSDLLLISSDNSQVESPRSSRRTTQSDNDSPRKSTNSPDISFRTTKRSRSNEVSYSRSSKRSLASETFNISNKTSLGTRRLKSSEARTSLSKSSQNSPVVSPRAKKESISSSRRSKSNENSPVLSRRSKSNENSPSVGRKSKANETSPIVVGRRSKSNENSPVVVGRRSKSNENSPIVGRKSKPTLVLIRKSKSDDAILSTSRRSKSNEASPMKRTSKSNENSPVVGRRSELNDTSLELSRRSNAKASPATGRKSKSTEDSLVIRKSKSNEILSTSRRSKSNEVSPINHSSKSNQNSPVVGRRPKSNENSPIVNRMSKNANSPVIGRKSKEPSLLVGRKSIANISSPKLNRSKSNEASPILRKSKSNTSSPVTRVSRSNPGSPVSRRSTKSNRNSSIESPIISRKNSSVSRKTESTPPSTGPAKKRKSRNENTPNENEGIHTPENRYSPADIGTPVLSIQSLLDSSQTSAKDSPKRGRYSNIKRKTIGVIRSEPRRKSAKSRSLIMTRHSRRLSKEDLEDEKMVTPRSAVKLVQEAVKNKHSTAKKPQSKRSIIDNLNESDIVKQLFNSPVKRKLSQSMTEFSRRQLFDDDEPRKPTRNTIAVFTTPDSSISDHTEAITPELFVSPINTPRNSPNLTGIKRLFRKDSPDNDLSNVKGVKSLLKTPRVRRSVRNDLTNVSGVKQVFAKSPKNRLSDVRVKEVFVSSPRDDLRRVSGVKTLFQSEKKRKSPRNDLSDVRGVRNLFKQKSPKNDLRRVSGVKRTLQIKNSPMNDLSDVRGVKRMFGKRGRNDLNDVSGVEELFNESNLSTRDSERLFDQLIGKPPIKAVYSKSFIKKAPHKPSTRATSLHALDNGNVEDWLEQELQKRLHKVPRELQKLATDTVQGAEPLLTSRIRNSSAPDHTLPLKKRSLDRITGRNNTSGTRNSGISTSGIRNSGIRSSGVRKPSLPLKKRIVVHSTPVKGRSRVTMNASELGRVSPIALDTSIRSEQQSTLPMQDPKPAKGKKSTAVATENQIVPPRATRSSPKAKSPKAKPSPKAKTPAKPTPKSKASPKKPSPSPKATKASRNAKPSPKAVTHKKTPAKDKSTSQKEVASPQPLRTRGKATKKRRTSLVISKKSPIMSPKPVPRTRRGQTKDLTKEIPVKSPSPKKTRAKKQEEKPATPKRTRAKVQKVTVVVSKPSPQMKPQGRSARSKDTETSLNKVGNTETTNTAGRRKKSEPKLETKAEPARRSRKTPASEIVEESNTKRRKLQSPKESPRKTRAAEPKGRKTVPKSPEKKVIEPRGRKTKGNISKKVQKSPEQKISEPKGRKTRANVSKDVPKSPEKKISEHKGRKTRANESKDAPKSPEKKSAPKGRKTKAIEVSIQKSPVTKRGRKTEAPEPKITRKTQPKDKVEEKKTEPKPTRSKKQVEKQASTQSEPSGTRRGKKLDTTVIPEVKTRKRKSTAEEVVPKKVSKVAETKGNKGRKTTVEATESTTNARQRRGAKKDATLSPKQNTSAKKETAKETVPKANSRKNKTEVVPSPVKQISKKSPVKRTRRTAPASPAAAKITRGKAEIAQVATKATGRSRRR